MRRFALALLVVLMLPAAAAAQVTAQTWPQIVWKTAADADFTIETPIEMYDDGATGGDTTASDGLFTGALAIPANGTAPRTIEYEVLPPNGDLTAAIGAAGGTPMQLSLPDGSATTVTVWFSTAADPSEPTTTACPDPTTILSCEGYGPVPSISDSMTDAGPFVVVGEVQAEAGGTTWDPSSTVTTLSGSGGTLDFSLLSTTDHSAATDLWRVATSGPAVTVTLGPSGWDFGGAPTTWTGYALSAPRWRILHFQMKPERGMARVTVETAGASLPLLSEIVTDPAAPFVEIENPASAPLSLAGVYLTDSPGYPMQGGTPAAVDAGDLDVGFPAGAIVPAGGYATVSIGAASAFQTTYGMAPDFVLSSMPPAFTGGVGTSPVLTPAGEFVALYSWLPGDDLVADLDVVTWGAPAAGEEAPLKTGVVVGASTYGDDSGVVNTSPAPAASAIARTSAADGAERSGATYNGVPDPVSGAREDETDETLSSSWAVETTPSPGAAAGGFTFTVSGTVTEQGTGNPLSGVTVTATPGGQTATTDQTGAYSLTLPGGTYSLGATLQNYADATASVTLDADKTVDIVMTPLPGVSVSGSVSRPDGTPIAAANVVLDDGTNQTTTQTAGDGTFSFSAVLPGQYTVRASKTGFRGASKSISVGSSNDVTGISLVLAIIPVGYDVSGKVLDATTTSPIPGATLRIDSIGAQVTTASDGTFVIHLVPDGTYNLVAGATGYASQGLQLVVKGKAVSGLVISLAKKSEALTLRGTVRIKNLSLPVVGAVVTLKSSGSLDLTATTTQVGTYLIAGIPAGSYDLSVSADGYNTITKPGYTLDKDTTLDFDLDRAAGRGFNLGGTVQLSDKDQGSWGGSKVVVTGPASGTILTAGDGSYQAKDLEPGIYKVIASHDGYVSAQVSVTLTSDVSQGFILNPKKKSTSGTGCGCSAAGGSLGSLVPFAALLLGLALSRRRRTANVASRSAPTYDRAPDGRGRKGG